MLGENIAIGSIYYGPLDQERDDITPKGGYATRNKYFVVIGTPEYGYYVAFVLVNKSVNEKFNCSKELKDAQFPLYRSDYPGIFDLEVSFLNLSRIRMMETERLIKEAEYKGKLTDKDLRLVLETIKNSDLIPPKVKRACGLI